ncbi:Acetyltransferase (GNAT) family protein [Variovorax sp. PBL-H6]|uniref:GNAT family N-acetyltransferase n=1 Tax=Variovorax sp. PBL-H6 TaxID=434009 RepID=UPI0013186859|nr:GNAT family N-acetyltransferase [Variovorax sp. PBL-H6]VTU35797.1 Acetyltransferase (GNAT) family protein [Variovorax sp. PBL-H6]
MPPTHATRLITSRLILRPWQDEDLEPFARLNADERATQYLLHRLTRAESDALVARIAAHFEREGFGLWAVEAPGVAPLVGAVGLLVPGFSAPFTPCVEIGWRLAPAFWGRGFATEAARAALAFGFERAGLDEIVAFTVPANTRSRAVMQRLGMTHSPADDFNHPRVPANHRLLRHVLYRLSKKAWRASTVQARR